MNDDFPKITESESRDLDGSSTETSSDVETDSVVRGGVVI